MLIILDDAWTIEEALSCQIGGPHCVYVLTTRLPNVAAQFAGLDLFHLPELDQAQSFDLLTAYAPLLRDETQDVAHALVQASGGLSLALKLIGINLMVQARHHQPRRLQATLARLQNVQERLRLGNEPDPRLPEGTPLTLQAMIHLSEKLLTAREKLALAALSVFSPKPQSFSEEAALAVMDASPDVLDRLVDVGLLESCGPERYQLHQTIADYARTRRTARQAEARLVRYVARYIERYQDQFALLDQEGHMLLMGLVLLIRSMSSRSISTRSSPSFPICVIGNHAI